MQRPLEKIYPVIFFHSINFRVSSEEGISIKSAYIATGVTTSGLYDVIGIWTGEGNSEKFWLDVFNSLKQRGIMDILIACVDVCTISAISSAMAKTYPKTDIQQCPIQDIKNSIKSVSKEDFRSLKKDFKQVYSAVDKQTAIYEFGLFREKWGNKYPKTVAYWHNNWENIAAYFQYPQEVRRLLYTTDYTEFLSEELQKVTNAVFPSDSSLIHLFYLELIDITQKQSGHLKNWKALYIQLESHFAGRILKS